MTMGTTRRTYSSEFKREAVELAARSGRTMAEVERELGLPEGLLKQWVRKVKRDGDAAFPGRGRLTATEEELRRLCASTASAGDTLWQEASGAVDAAGRSARQVQMAPASLHHGQQTQAAGRRECAEAGLHS
jgi:transposase